MEPVDIYSDHFMLTTTPWGAHLSFFITEPHPETVKVVPAERMATIRMSNEHLKVMTFIALRQLKKMESDTGIKIEVDPRALNSLGIAREDWDNFCGK